MSRWRLRALLALAAIAAVVTALVGAPRADARVVSWSYQLYWGGSGVLVFDLYTGTGVYREVAVDTILLPSAISGQLIGVDPVLDASPGVLWAACQLFVNGVLMVSDYAYRGDGTDVVCLWRVP